MSSSTPSKTDHLIPLPGGEFSIWPVALLRSAGMPSAWVERLADAELVTAVERLFEAEIQSDAAKAELCAALEVKAAATAGDEHHSVVKDLRRVRRGRPPNQPHADASAWTAARAAVAEARAAFDQAYAAAHGRVRARLCELGRENSIRCAVAWQNPHALREGIDRLLAAGAVDNKQTRKYEQLLASYVQRYCVKNDSIGFFGPLGWADLDAAFPGMRHESGEPMIESRHVYFEGWSIAKLAAKLGEDKRLRPWLRPRRLPLVGLHDGAAYLPFSPKPMALSPAEYTLVAQSDSTRSAVSLAEELMAEHGVGSHDEAFGLIDGLVKKGLLVWKLETPMDFKPEQRVREILSSITDDELRASNLGALDKLEAARGAVAEVADDAEALAPALAALDQAFHELTGQAPTHSQGKVYAGRTVAYVEARRSDRVTLGKAVLDAMGPTMSILMRAARWFTRELANVYRRELSDLYKKMAQQAGQAEVPYLRFWLAAQRLFHLRPSSRAPLPPYVQQLVDRFVERWGTILGQPDPAARRLHYRSEDLLPTVNQQFESPGPGWTWARYGSPDIMIDAANAEAVSKGEFKVIVGEFHMAVHSFLTHTGIQHHPNPKVLFDMVDADHPEPLLCPLIPSDMYPHRVHLYLNNQNGYELSFAPEMPTHTRGIPLAAGELLVVPAGADAGVSGEQPLDLVVRTRDSRIRFDLLETVGVALMSTCVNSMSFMPRSFHRPRIEIDNVVVQRESWYARVADLPFADAKQGADRFLGVRRWAEEHGIPRQVFIMVPVEEKPMYIDLNSPVFVDILCKLVRASQVKFPESSISMSEMLPAHRGMWLEDRQGNRYTSELRCTILDPRPTVK